MNATDAANEMVATVLPPVLGFVRERRDLLKIALKKALDISFNPSGNPEADREAIIGILIPAAYGDESEIEKRAWREASDNWNRHVDRQKAIPTVPQQDLWLISDVGQQHLLRKDGDWCAVGSLGGGKWEDSEFVQFTDHDESVVFCEEQIAKDCHCRPCRVR